MQNALTCFTNRLGKLRLLNQEAFLPCFARFFKEVEMDNVLLLVLYVSGLVAVVLILFLTRNTKTLDSIKSERVGDGQHGSASWGDEQDLLDKGFVKVHFPKEMQTIPEWEVGRVLHWDENGKTAWVDPSYSHCATMAPTDVGKTTKFVVPNIMYNAMAGANMIVPDLKGELHKILGHGLRNKVNYNVVNINFSDVEQSVGIDFLELLRESVENIEKYPDRAGYWSAQAETQAKIIASQIQASRERGSQENGFFLSASNGILSSVLYLVAMLGKKEQVHFSSVRSIIQELGTARKGQKKSALQELLDKHPVDFPPRKLSGAAYSAPLETEANIYASALSDLDIYTNAMAEQVVSTMKNTFNWKDLVDESKKTIVFIELPETRKDMFVFFTLFLNQVYERLSQHAQAQASGKLPVTLKVIWDEFGISPKLNDLPTMLNVSRGRGILFDIIYQSEDQLEEVYGKVGQQIVQKACNTNLYLGLAPKDIETAKNLSTILGTYTVKAGSVSKSYNTKDLIFNDHNRSITEQMQSKDLASADELLRMGATSILIKQNMRPFKPNNIPFYAKEYPTSLMNNEKATQLQKEEIDQYLKAKLVDESKPVTKCPSYLEYQKSGTVLSADKFIVEAKTLTMTNSKWNKIEYLDFATVTQLLNDLHQKQSTVASPEETNSSYNKSSDGGVADQVTRMLMQCKIAFEKHPNNQQLEEYISLLSIYGGDLKMEMRNEIGRYLKGLQS